MPPYWHNLSGKPSGIGINAANSYIDLINNLLCAAYKKALELPKAATNRVSWKFSGQRSFNNTINKLSESFLLKCNQLNSKILNN